MEVTNKKNIVVACPIATRSGYGAHSREICAALIKSNKYNVSIVPTKWGDTPQTALADDNPNDRMFIDRFISGTLTTQPDVFIQITIPNEFQVVGKYNIGVTAGIETTLCRYEWIEGCNRADAVVVSSKFAKDVFIGSSYTQVDQKTNTVLDQLYLKTSTIVIPEGLDTSVFSVSSTILSDVSTKLEEIPERFCYLFVGHWLDGEIGHDRKDVAMLVKTFLEAFIRNAPDNRPALILKTNTAGYSIIERDQIVSKIQAVKSIIRNSGWAGDFPNIYILHGDLTDQQMNELYNHPKVKAMVSFTKGEGFGKPFLEFATTGKPLIVSNWSGQVDYLVPEYNYLIPGKVSPVHPSSVNDFIIKESQWFTADYAIGGKFMRDVYNNYAEATSRSKKNKKHIADNFNIDIVQKMFCDLIDNIEEISKQKYTHQNVNVPAEVKLNLPKLQMKTDEPKKLTLPKLNVVK